MMASSTVEIGLLLPDLLGTYGDNGNATVLRRRLEWRGIDCRIVSLGLDDDVPESLDLYVLGGGEDSGQTVAAAHLRSQRGLRRAAEHGAVVFGVCAGFQILGQSFTSTDGATTKGVELFDVTTGPANPRAVGEILTRPTTDLLTGPLTGFENHQGHSTLGPDVAPLGTVTRGIGNGDGTDGVLQGHLVGTYLHGPVLARNPELADLLLSTALGRRLEPLDVEAVTRLRRERLAAVAAR